MTRSASILTLLGPVIEGCPPADRPLLLALGERIAASRYRVWAEASEDPSVRKTLEACARREEEVAARVEALRPDATAVQAKLSTDHPDLRDRFFELFSGRPLEEQFAMQAEAERAGAAAWRAFAAATPDATQAAALAACAPLEEASAEALERLRQAMKNTA